MVGFGDSPTLPTIYVTYHARSGAVGQRPPCIGDGGKEGNIGGVLQGTDIQQCSPEVKLASKGAFLVLKHNNEVACSRRFSIARGG
jgi:hypothetical protein